MLSRAPADLVHTDGTIVYIIAQGMNASHEVRPYNA